MNYNVYRTARPSPIYPDLLNTPNCGETRSSGSVLMPQKLPANSYPSCTTAAAGTANATCFFVEASLSIEHPLRTPPPDKPWARPTRTRVRTVHSAILRLAGVLHGHNLLRAPHKHLQRLCKIWSLVRRITSEVAAAGAAATVSSLSLSGMPIQCG